MRLTHEIQDRQKTSYNINSIFEDDYITPMTDNDRNNPKIVFMTAKYFKIINGERMEYFPPPKTIEQMIEADKKYYLREIENFAEPIFVGDPKDAKFNRKKPLKPFHRMLWDTRPYIQPIKEVIDNRENRGKYAFRKNVEEYDEFPTISINLDFSDDVILSDIKQHLKKLRKELKHRQKFMPPKELIKKFKNFRTLQVIDVLLWQKLTEQHIEYETLAAFLFPQGQFTGKQLRETIIPFAKKLLDSNSNESAYLFYLSDQSSEK